MDKKVVDLDIGPEEKSQVLFAWGSSGTGASSTTAGHFGPQCGNQILGPKNDAFDLRKILETGPQNSGFLAAGEA